VKLSFNQLQQALDSLTERYEHEVIDLVDYVDEWDDVVTAAGWSQEEFSAQVDSSWSSDKRKRILLPKC
jgi:hypothetical protein